MVAAALAPLALKGLPVPRAILAPLAWRVSKAPPVSKARRGNGASPVLKVIPAPQGNAVLWDSAARRGLWGLKVPRGIRETWGNAG